ncbi:NOC3 family protein [Staphylococcus hyicus]|uniref:hypothetical protein n=1 Tax=Staphylococcus hyicus TaxID=1284 RepID=UPI00057D8073|nr:hypothetical protein [Staphylococcus hyicus]AJC95746.1 hypothetical protein SHYC_04925 [Staphylococcus hyicus]MDP4468712.1 hypothetical protein [Staphylococcus hyicus]RTX68376.1 hypothetical protein EKQ60_05505 [Staphylococcus hyicus]SQE47244.1 phage protein [Staphylococcus hyicus]
MNNFSNSISMSTQVLNVFEDAQYDIRFTKVKIWLMHLGENRNGSVFTREVVENAIPTLANTPIMGSIGLNNYGEEDFYGHESDLEITEDGELKFINKTIPFGVIPESNNAKFEKRIGDDMIEREYLTVEGILWNKWEDAINLIHGKNGVTGQSMELSDNYTGYFDGELFKFDSFEFYGACLLGDDILPAMNNSTVELKYSVDTKNFIDEKIREFNTKFSSIEGGTVLEKKKTNFDNESTEDFGLDLDNVEEGLEIIERNKSKEVEETSENSDSDNELEESNQDEEEQDAKEELHDEETESSDVEEEQVEETPSPKEKEVPKKKPTKKQSPQKQDSKQDTPTISDKVVETINNDVETLDELGNVHDKIRKAQENLPKPSELIIVGDAKYSVEDIQELLEKAKKLDEVSQEFAALKEQVHTEKVQSLFNKYSDQLTSEEINTLKSKSSDITIEELETQIFAVIGKKSFSIKSHKNNESVSISKIGLSFSNAKANTLDAILEEL